MYTFLGAPVLGYDLIRRADGHEVASVLVRALALDQRDLALVAEVVHADERASAWMDIAEVADAEPRVQSVMAEASRLAVDPQTVSAMARSLGRAALGSLDDLLRLVRREILDWTWVSLGERRVQDDVAARAATVVCDAAAASYLADSLSAESRRTLTRPWEAALARMPHRRVHLGPQHDLVVACLRRLSRLDERDVARLRDSVSERELLASWGDALQDATSAARVTGRLRAAAAAQLMAVEALQRGGLPAEVGAVGAWNVVSGYVQALVVADVLDQLTQLRLTMPLRAALGTPA
ncbi:MAG: hypothetical protein ACRDYU_15390 [Actinomycetes bacterium]